MGNHLIEEESAAPDPFFFLSLMIEICPGNEIERENLSFNPEIIQCS